MSDAKDNESFLRKVVRFVANPTTDWADLSQRPEELRETEYAKTELKQMIERKRRNDFVRKREFDMLRKVRREGLTSEQIAALGGSSRLDDSDGRMQENIARADDDVKAKINAIEKQMVGESYGISTRRPPPGTFYDAATSPAPLEGARGHAAGRRGAPVSLDAPTQAAIDPPLPPAGLPVTASGRVPFAEAPPQPNTPTRPAPAAIAVAPAVMSAALPPLSTRGIDAGVDFSNPFAVEVSEVAHDPDLDEAVIGFANADFEQCEQSLAALTTIGGARAQHAETWLVRFDLYRAIGEQHKFESLALDYAQQFGWSAPQWFSMPRLVAEAAAASAKGAGTPASPTRIDSQVGWACPGVIDVEAVARLHSQSLQMPLPWVFDWLALERVEPEACARLSELFRHWAGERLEMRWLGGERLFEVLAESSPTGVKDVDPAVWQLRLDALRLANRADRFDETAIDYCVTYEVSPPSWERPVCQVHVSGRGTSTASPAMTVVSESPSSFLESTINDEAGSASQVASVELSGQLVGDISETLAKMDRQLGTASLVNVSCAKLIRVDFIAAGDLLNWVLQRRNENRVVSFTDSHRLVALFFGAMGINEHAKVKVRSV